MPSLAHLRTHDPDQLRVALRPAASRFTLTGRGRFAASVTAVDLFDLGLQQVSETLPRTWPVTIPPERYGLVFVGTGPALGWRGVQGGVDDILLAAPGVEATHTLIGGATWGSISLPPDRLEAVSGTLMGRDLTPPRNAVSLSVAPAGLHRLRRLHGAVAQMARLRPDIIAQPTVARAVEQTALEAFMACLVAGTPHHEMPRAHRRTRVMRRFLDLAEQTAGAPLHLPEVCVALGVPARTLHIYCQEQLGISPKRYLLLRRMHLARAALRDPAPGAQTVTEVATAFGFWEFGRFAASYRALFGEYPSATLHAARARAG